MSCHVLMLWCDGDVACYIISFVDIESYVLCVECSDELINPVKERLHDMEYEFNQLKSWAIAAKEILEDCKDLVEVMYVEHRYT